MSVLSDVSLLIAERAGDLEKAREIFTAETRSFVKGVLAGIRRARSDPWTMPRVRVDLPRDIETESKATASIRDQYALARVSLRFKKGTNYQVVADVNFGIGFDEPTDRFVWQVYLVPAARYQRMDDLVWQHLRTLETPIKSLPGAAHQDRANQVRFVSRALGPETSAEVAFNDAKAVLEFLVVADAPLAEAVGLDAAPEETVA
jgi:hypothetical protein